LQVAYSGLWASASLRPRETWFFDYTRLQTNI